MDEVKTNVAADLVQFAVVLDQTLQEHIVAEGILQPGDHQPFFPAGIKTIDAQVKVRVVVGNPNLGGSVLGSP